MRSPGSKNVVPTAPMATLHVIMELAPPLFSDTPLVAFPLHADIRQIHGIP